MRDKQMRSRARGAGRISPLPGWVISRAAGAETIWVVPKVAKLTVVQKMSGGPQREIKC